jgi:hypothetical protein
MLTLSCNNVNENVTFRDIAEEISLRYNSPWYWSVAFMQNAIHYVNGQPADTQLWHEVYMYPGKLIIKYDSISSGSGLLFRNDSMYDIRNDTIIAAQHMPHDLIVLTMDMYRMKTDDIIKRVSELGYDTALVQRNTFKGKQMYMIGAKDSSDRESRQFWLDVDDLICYRVIIPRDYGTREVAFDRIYFKNGRWIEQEVIFKRNGVTDIKEEYFKIVFNYPVDSNIFSPSRFSERKW